MNDDNIYIIKKGDTFWDLENEWGMPHGTLQSLNPDLKPRELPIGGTMKIKMPTLVYLIAEEIPQDTYRNNAFRDYYEVKVDNLRVDNGFIKPPLLKGFEECEVVQNDYDSKISAENVMTGLNIGAGILSLEDLRRTRTLTSNELWHLQKNGAVTHPWKKMRNGASHWKNNLVRSQRTLSQSASKAQSIKGLSKLGPGLLLADVALSGEIKPSHAVNAVLIGASTTGVGAIFAGIYFIADVGTGFVTGSSISERLDGWAADNVGRLELYEGLY